MKGNADSDPATRRHEAVRLLAARGLRGFADGMISLLLPIYLARLGFEIFEIGALSTATLLGTALFTLLAGLFTHRWSERNLLVAAALIMFLTGVAFSQLENFWPLLLVAFLGTLNPSTGDFSIFLPMEHARLARLARQSERTAVFARYGLVGVLSAAAGALSVGVPDWLAARLGIEPKLMLQAAFLLYALLGLAAALIYRTLPQDASGGSAGPARRPRTPSRAVLGLAALFGLDAFAGGLVVQSLLALWLLQRFDLSVAATGLVFFWSGVLAAFSYLLVPRVARRLGLINTMVFTHLPANLCLALVPIMPSALPAIGLLLVRSILGQMDVPARNAYVMAMVPPTDRAAAASMVNMPRSLAAAASPLLGGALFSLSGFGWPLVLAGALRILYDVLLLALFRNRHPPDASD